MLVNKQSVKDTKECVQSILKEKGIDYSNWKREVINKRKLSVMSDEDKKWVEQVIWEESLMLIVEDQKERKNQPSTPYDQSGNHNNLNKGSEQ